MQETKECHYVSLFLRIHSKLSQRWYDSEEQDLRTKSMTAEGDIPQEC